MTTQHFSLVVKVVKNMKVLPQLAKTTYFNLAYVHQYMPNERKCGLIRDVRQGPF